MNKELEKKLFTTFPRLFRRHGRARRRVNGYGICTDDGWYKLIHELCVQIQKHAAENDLDPVALQVKEKLGGLRFYLRGADERIDALIDGAERRSFKICEVCGEPGQLRAHGWLRTLCDKHYDDDYARENGTEDAQC